MSNIRAAEIYIQRKTYRRLYWVASARGEIVDKLADDIINESLEQKYPQILPAEAKIKEVEHEFTQAFTDAQAATFGDKHVKLD